MVKSRQATNRGGGRRAPSNPQACSRSLSSVWPARPTARGRRNRPLTRGGSQSRRCAHPSWIFGRFWWIRWLEGLPYQQVRASRRQLLKSKHPGQQANPYCAKNTMPAKSVFCVFTSHHIVGALHTGTSNSHRKFLNRDLLAEPPKSLQSCSITNPFLSKPL